MSDQTSWVGVISTVLLAACLGPRAPEPRREPLQRSGISETYDQTDGRTWLDAYVPLARAENLTLRLGARSRSEGGDVIYGSPYAVLDARSFRGWRFLHSHRVTLVVDGYRMEYAETTHQGRVSSPLLESVLFYPDLVDIERIANAATVHGRVGGEPFELTPLGISVVRDFWRRLEVKKENQAEGGRTNQIPLTQSYK